MRKIAFLPLIILIFLVQIMPLSSNAQIRSLKLVSTKVRGFSSPSQAALNENELESSCLKSEGKDRSPSPSNQEVDAQGPSTSASHVGSHDWGSALAPAPPPRSMKPVADAPSTRRVTICNSASWRDKYNYLDYIRYGVFLVNSIINWILGVVYVTDLFWQSYCNLTSFILSYTSLFVGIAFRDHMSSWKITKLATNGAVFLIGGILDSIVYDDFNHIVALIFSVLVEGFLFSYLEGYVNMTNDTIGIITAASKLGSSLILIVGFLSCLSWNYVSFELLTAVLGMICNFLYIFETCGTTSLVLIILTILSQLIYTGLLVRYFRRNHIPMFRLSSGIDGANHREFVRIAETLRNFCTWFNTTQTPSSSTSTPTTTPPTPRPPSTSSPTVQATTDIETRTIGINSSTSIDTTTGIHSVTDIHSCNSIHTNTDIQTTQLFPQDGELEVGHGKEQSQQTDGRVTLQLLLQHEAILSVPPTEIEMVQQKNATEVEQMEGR